MKPENHAIRQLRQQLEGATPEVAGHIECVIAALNACVMNAHDPAALAMCRRGLDAELSALEKLKGSP